MTRVLPLLIAKRTSENVIRTCPGSIQPNCAGIIGQHCEPIGKFSHPAAYRMKGPTLATPLPGCFFSLAKNPVNTGYKAIGIPVIMSPLAQIHRSCPNRPTRPITNGVNKRC